MTCSNADPGPLPLPAARIALRVAASRAARKGLLGRLGPGLITGAADDDPSGISTYSVAGASLGYSILWTALFSFPLTDSLTAFRQTTNPDQRRTEPVFSTVAILNCYVLSTLFWGESFTDLPAFFLRAFPQILILYVLVFFLTRWASLRLR